MKVSRKATKTVFVYLRSLSFFFFSIWLCIDLSAFGWTVFASEGMSVKANRKQWYVPPNESKLKFAGYNYRLSLFYFNLYLQLSLPGLTPIFVNNTFPLKNFVFCPKTSWSFSVLWEYSISNLLSSETLVGISFFLSHYWLLWH